MYDLAILNGQLYIDGALIKKNIYINSDHIVAVSEEEHMAKEVYNAQGKWVLPGLIDPHVHFELGGPTYRATDDFYTGSITAAFGGITTVIDFLDPVSKAKDLERALDIRKTLASKSMIDYRFHVTVKNPVGQVEEIVHVMKDLGLHSVKCFTTYSESGRRTYDRELNQLISLSGEADFLVLAHIEKDDTIHMDSSYEVKDLPLSRPESAETSEALKLAEVVKNTNGQLYMVHLSSGATLEALVEQYADILGTRLHIESCPHYFTFNEDVYKDEKGSLYAMAPPLRNEAARLKLEARFGWIDTIGTDHCPFTAAEKQQPLLKDIPMGIGGVEHAFNIMVSKFGIQAVDKMSTNPAKIFGLYPQKGSLDIGTDADIIIYNPNQKHKITFDHSEADYSVYEGIEVDGQIESTICKGHFVIKKQELVIGSVGHYIEI